MIERYTRPEMGRIWTEEAKYSRWLMVEQAAAEAMAELGIIPSEAAQAIVEKGGFDLDRIAEVEAVVRHDVIAFLTSVGEQVGEQGRWLHLGMTSSDMLDTATALALVEASELLLERLSVLQATVRRQAERYRRTPCIGRSHGIHAEPTTFGLKLAIWYDELRRGERRLRNAAEEVRVGKISGSVGTFANVDPRVEARVCERLGLQPAPASSQIVQRDRHASFLQAIALLGTSIDKFATEIRHLQRTEVSEAAEGFALGQKGSSSMPHKKNPITCEQMTGLARLLRANSQVALENVVLWHERDISHSSAERVILPDSTILLYHMLVSFERVMDRLVVDEQRMAQNLSASGSRIFSQRVLLELVKAGDSREDAYARTQKLAFEASESGRSLQELCLADPVLLDRLGEKILAACFEIKTHFQHIDLIFRRVFEE